MKENRRGQACRVESEAKAEKLQRAKRLDAELKALLRQMQKTPQPASSNQGGTSIAAALDTLFP